MSSQTINIVTLYFIFSAVFKLSLPRLFKFIRLTYYRANNYPKVFQFYKQLPPLIATSFQKTPRRLWLTGCLCTLLCSVPPEIK